MKRAVLDNHLTAIATGVAIAVALIAGLVLFALAIGKLLP